MWDNRCTQHRVCADNKTATRRMERITIGATARFRRTEPIVGVGGLSVSIEIADTPELRASFVDFYDSVYECRAARWPGNKAQEHLLLSGESPLTIGKPFKALLALDDGKVVARAVALVDLNYLAHWNDRVGHI